MNKAIDGLARFINPRAPINVKTVASAYALHSICYEAKKYTSWVLADHTKALDNRAMLYAKLGEREKARADTTAARHVYSVSNKLD
mgnify:FL=1